MGETTLPLRCAEILLQRGHNILGLISADALNVEWAKNNGVKLINPTADLVPILQAEPFDYFISANNLAMIPDEILKLPRKYGINFHDGPLPRYAGLHVTAWALMNHETKHAVTWHIMTEKVDAGDILKQMPVTIVPGETSLTFNAKGYQAAIQGFAELVEELETGTTKPQQQNMEDRSYFAGSKRPPAASALLWNRDARDLSALVRALDFGIYFNPLGLPKLVLDGDVVLVSEVTELNSSSRAAPGTITGIKVASLQVATTTNDILIRGLRDMQGQAITVSEVITKHRLHVGAKLPILDDDTVKALSEFHEATAKYEKAWVHQLAALESIEIPYTNWDVAPDEPARYETLELTVPAKTYEQAEQPVSDLLMTTFAAYLARLSERASFDLGFHDDSALPDIPGFDLFFATSVPLRLTINADQNFNEITQTVGKQLQRVRQRKSYPSDAALRWPELASASLDLPVAVAHVRDAADYRPALGSQFTMVIAENGGRCFWVYDARRLDKASVSSLQRQFETFLDGVFANPEQPIHHISLLTQDELHRLLVEWNDTALDYPHDACVHQLFEAQVELTPDAVAVACEDRQLTYRELNNRANRLANYLRQRGVGPDVPVGICMERSLDMMVGLLAILKAGGAYVPMDPTYPAERISFMLEDSGISVLLTTSDINVQLPHPQVGRVCLDTDWPAIAQEPSSNLDVKVASNNLAYVIYTSGSTGKPKGVMIEHRNVVNFFYAMDERVGYHTPGTWLAVTSISFDISVLELFWTLARGYKVVIYSGQDKEVSPASRLEYAAKPIDFSLFYFSSDEGESVADKYRLLVEGAKFGDTHGFSAVWTPERHFHAFGGLYPNPSVTSAALATITTQIKLRAGSVVSPLHNPLRIAEEWSVVDNLSNGRVGISFASGWQPNDFVLAPQNFADRKDLMFRQIDTIRQLWRGEAVSVPGPVGKDVTVSILPRPIQADLPVWVTAAGNPETFRMAGEMGYNLLTHLLGQSVEELAEKIALYRQAWHDAGHSGEGHLTLMLHSFVGESNDEVRELVRGPMKAYLRSSVGLIQQAAWSFPTFKQTTTSDDGKFSIDHLSEDQLDDVLDFAFDRYFETSGLFGTPATCLKMVDKLKGVGVDEIACLIDFGVDSETVLTHLADLNRVREQANVVSAQDDDYSIPALINRHAVTHLQCTPSMASMLLLTEESRRALGKLRQLMIGGEAFPVALAHQLKQRVTGDIINMYGPTETTIWSSTHPVADPDHITIGRPIANTEFYVLDRNCQPVPIGVPGELFIGGDGVVRGYLDRPELTNERFIPHPFKHNSNSRLYRTGDLVRYQQDGNVEFLGRIDHQVKIRGYRIELGEIEAALGKHKAILETVVVANEDENAQKRLVAYIVGKNGTAPNVAELRSYLKETLPEFMIPALFEPLDALPRTPNGKIDRRALPAPGQARQTHEGEYIAPRDELENQIVELWEKELGVKPIGVRDNFFELGGHSLLAVRLFAQIEQKYDKRLPLATFFKAPTVEQLADILRQEGWTAPTSLLVEIQPNGTNPPFFCIHAHGGHVMFYYNLSRHMGSDQPFYGIQAQGLDGELPPYTRFEDMAAHYIREIRAVQPEGPYYVGGDCMGGQIAFEVAQQLQAQGQEIALLAMIDSYRFGCPSYRPMVTPTMYELLHLGNKFFRVHLKNVMRLSGKERAAYVSEKSKSAMLIVDHTAKHLAAKLNGGSIATHDPLLETQDALEHASITYQPRPFKGRITLFRSSILPKGVEVAPDLGWSDLAEEGVEVHEIPAYFTTAILEPKVQTLAQEMRNAIDEALLAHTAGKLAKVAQYA
jgi:natural product biosynthesis luciferase-like monooxygenase protein